VRLGAIVVTAGVVAVDEPIAVVVNLVFARGTDELRATRPAPLRPAISNAARVVAVDESICVVVSEVCALRAVSSRAIFPVSFCSAKVDATRVIAVDQSICVVVDRICTIRTVGGRATRAISFARIITAAGILVVAGLLSDHRARVWILERTCAAHEAVGAREIVTEPHAVAHRPFFDR